MLLRFAYTLERTLRYTTLALPGCALHITLNIVVINPPGSLGLQAVSVHLNPPIPTPSWHSDPALPSIPPTLGSFPTVAPDHIVLVYSRPLCGKATLSLTLAQTLTLNLPIHT